MGGRKVSTILSGDLKLVCSLKEVVPHTEEEIYAMLKECNKDPDETVQRLLKEDKFHVVKRKREKKKENAGNVKSASECQLSGGAGIIGRSKRSSGAPDKQGTGKGNSSLRRNTSEQFGVRNKMENRAVFSTKASMPVLGGNLSYSQLGQELAFKSLLPSQDTNRRSEASAIIEEICAVGPVSGPPSVLQGAWRVGSGRGTLAEMLKMSIIPDKQKPLSTTQETISGMLDATSLEQHSGQSVSPSLMNPTSNSSMGSFPQSYSSVVKEESNTTDRSSMGYHESILMEHTHENIRISPFPLERDAAVLLLPPTNMTNSESREQIPDLSNNQKYLTGIAEAHRLPDIVTEHITASLHKGNLSTETNKDLKSDSAHSQEDLSVANHSPHSRDIGILSVATSKLKQLNLHDKHSVIIPEHIRIREADCPILSFGSFDVGFENCAAGFNTEEAIHFPVSEGVTEDGLLVTPNCAAVSLTSTNTSDNLDQQQQIGSGTLLQKNEPMTDSSDTTEEVLSEKASNTSCPESFPEVYIITSNDENKYTAKSSPLENNTSMPVGGSTYYSSAFQPDADIDARYSSFLQGGAFHKVDSIKGHAEASGLNTISREVNNDVTVPISNIIGGGNTASTVDFIPSAAEAALEHSLEHATTQPLGPYANVFDYQYMPSGFSYLQSPYQHNYLGVGNYQVPTPAISDTGMKYSLPQYSSKVNNKATGVNSMIVPGGLGYGVGYSNPQSGSFPGNPSVTTGNASSFEDTVPQQFKDICNVQNPSQQIEGSSVWLQNQLTREVQGNNNNNLYYNLAASQNQQQQLRYAQAQSSLLANNGHHQPALYSYPYHSQHEQSGSSSTVQQLLQQHVLAPLGQSLLSNGYPTAPYCNLYQTQQSSSNSTLQQQLLLQQHQNLGTLGTQSGQAQQRAHTMWPNVNGY